MELVRNRNPFNVHLRTARLLLRRVKESDDKDMFEYTSNPDVTTFLSWNPHTDIAQAKEYISSLILEYELSDRYAWAVEEYESHKFIGIVRIFDVSYANKRGELSYILNPDFQGRGLAVEAIKAVMEFCFTTVGLNRIQAKCTPDNVQSERVIRKIGMIYEGMLKEFWINKGSPSDAKLFALLAANYANMISENSFAKDF